MSNENNQNRNDSSFEEAGRDALRQMATGFAQKEQEVAKVRAEMTAEAQAKITPPTEKELLARLVAIEEAKLVEAKNREMMDNPSMILSAGFEQTAKERAEREKVTAEIAYRKSVAGQEAALRAAFEQAALHQRKLEALKAQKN